VAWGVVPVLEGALVLLEPLTRDHVDALWDASRDPRIWRWMSDSQPRSRTEFSRFVEKALSHDRIPFATRELPGGRIVGSTSFLALRPEHRSVEIGATWLHPDAWQRGINAEAKLLMLRHAFETWACRRVELKTDALNERSRRALETLGASFEGIHRKHMLVRDGESRDTAWYSIVDDEWPAVAARLAARVQAHLVRDGGRGELGDERVAREALEREGGDQAGGGAGRRELREGRADDRGGLEAVGAPAGAEVEVVDGRLAEDRAVIG
jgi:RimJ/RimL family protein N-acetyltransferase